MALSAVWGGVGKNAKEGTPPPGPGWGRGAAPFETRLTGGGFPSETAGFGGVAIDAGGGLSHSPRPRRGPEMDLAIVRG